MALSKDAQAWIDKQSYEFMVPVVIEDEFVEYEDKFDTFLTPRDAFNWGDVKDGELSVTLHKGFFARLSAPGYMDATDWLGPYATEDEAFEALYEQYGDE